MACTCGGIGTYVRVCFRSSGSESIGRLLLGIKLGNNCNRFSQDSSLFGGAAYDSQSPNAALHGLDSLSQSRGNGDLTSTCYLKTSHFRGSSVSTSILLRSTINRWYCRFHTSLAFPQPTEHGIDSSFVRRHEQCGPRRYRFAIPRTLARRTHPREFSRC